MSTLHADEGYRSSYMLSHEYITFNYGNIGYYRKQVTLLVSTGNYQLLFFDNNQLTNIIMQSLAINIGRLIFFISLPFLLIIFIELLSLYTYDAKAIFESVWFKNLTGVYYFLVLMFSGAWLE